MAKQKEIWRDIEGYEGKYQVSNLGRVKSLNYRCTKQECVLSLINRTCNYLKVSLSKDGAYKKISIHRLVAIAFLPNPENKPYINHIDGNKQNNNVNNLEWVTQKENMRHATKKKLLRNSGQHNGNAKLTNKQARKIRKEYIPKDKKYGQKALAKKYSVSQATIHCIIHHKTYKNI